MSDLNEFVEESTATIGSFNEYFAARKEAGFTDLPDRAGEAFVASLTAGCDELSVHDLGHILINLHSFIKDCAVSAELFESVGEILGEEMGNKGSEALGNFADVLLAGMQHVVEATVERAVAQNTPADAPVQDERNLAE